MFLGRRHMGGSIWGTLKNLGKVLLKNATPIVDNVGKQAVQVMKRKAGQVNKYIVAKKKTIPATKKIAIDFGKQVLDKGKQAAVTKAEEVVIKIAGPVEEFKKRPAEELIKAISPSIKMKIPPKARKDLKQILKTNPSFFHSLYLYYCWSYCSWKDSCSRGLYGQSWELNP